MDDYIRKLIEKLEKGIISPNENLPSTVHEQNIPYFSYLNYDSKINIFDIFSLKVKYVAGEVIIKENKSGINCLTKGSRILKINDVHPLSVFSKSYELNIEFDQKVNEKKFIRKYLTLKVPAWNSEFEKYEIRISGENLYIKIYRFNKNQFKEINITKNYFERIVIDMRDNMGGAFSDMISFLELFFECNSIMMNIEVFDSEYTIKSKTKNKIGFDKIYVLVNRNTYSCSEIITSVLHERFKAVVIGEKTGGKLSITKVYKINSSYYTVPIGEYKCKGEFEILKISSKAIDNWLDKKIL